MSAQRMLFGCVVVSLAALVGCGGGIEGTYSGRGTGFLEKIVFKSGGKVELTFMGMTKEGTYVVEGDRVKVTNGNDTSILTVGDDGCLDGGGLLGRYCKEGSSPSPEAAQAPAASTSRGLSGTWEARHPQGSIALAFHDAGKVRITITEGGVVDDSADGTYTIEGDRVTVLAGGPPLELTRAGNTLEGWMQGVGMKFVRAR